MRILSILAIALVTATPSLAMRDPGDQKTVASTATSVTQNCQSQTTFPPFVGNDSLPVDRNR